MPQLALIKGTKIVESGTRLNQPFKCSANFDNSLTKQMLPTARIRRTVATFSTLGTV